MDTSKEKKFSLFTKKPKKDKKDMTFKEKVIDNIKVFFSAYAIAFFIRLFVIEAYQIPSQSMVPSLWIKDILMVEKVCLGTYLPILGWKMPGFVKPERNDIIVFISPAWESPGFWEELVSLLTLSLVNLDNTFDTPKNLVKRLVAIPGDTLSMSNRILTLNGKPLQTDYIFTSKQVVYDRLVNIGTTDFDVYQEVTDDKKRLVQRLYGDTGFKRDQVYMFDEIKVPQKGVEIDLRKASKFYRELLMLLIERESGKSVMSINEALFMDGMEITNWIPNDNYYFAMGDNRDFSEDCRYFGFIPEKNIFGRPLFRYFPFNRLGFDVNEYASAISNKDFK